MGWVCNSIIYALLFICLDAGKQALVAQLGELINVLDSTDWQKNKLQELKLTTVGDVLKATKGDLKKANYVGDIRARQMRNAVEAAVFEYLSG